MAKTLLAIITFLISSFSVLLVCCALIVAGRYDKCDEKYRNEQICPKCETGKYTYKLDPKATMCPNISCCKNGKCPFYKPLEKMLKTKTIR